MNEQNMNNFGNEAMASPLPFKNNMPSTKYQSKPSGLGKAGAVLNIIFAALPLPILFILTLISALGLVSEGLVSESWVFLIFILVFAQMIALEICTIVSSARFLEGKGNKKMAGILGIFSGSFLGGIFILCSYRI